MIIRSSSKKPKKTGIFEVAQRNPKRPNFCLVNNISFSNLLPPDYQRTIEEIKNNTKIIWWDAFSMDRKKKRLRKWCAQEIYFK